MHRVCRTRLERPSAFRGRTHPWRSWWSLRGGSAVERRRSGSSNQRLARGGGGDLGGSAGRAPDAKVVDQPVERVIGPRVKCRGGELKSNTSSPRPCPRELGPGAGVVRRFRSSRALLRFGCGASRRRGSVPARARDWLRRVRYRLSRARLPDRHRRRGEARAPRPRIRGGCPAPPTRRPAPSPGDVTARRWRP